MKPLIHSLLVFFLLLPALSARVISYAPVTDRYAVPAVQNRMMRHYLLMESKSAAPLFWGCQISAGCPGSEGRRGQFVLYDAWGEEPPRVLSFGGENDPEPTLRMAALWEEEGAKLRMLLLTDARHFNDNPDRATRLLYSPDGGENWRIIGLAAGSYVPLGNFFEDVGGRFVRARGSQVRIGSAEMPFVFTVNNDQAKTSRVYGMLRDGTPLLLADMLGNNEHACCRAAVLIGSDREGKRFLITGAQRNTPSPVSRLWILDTAGGSLTDIGASTKDRTPWLDGWITPSGNAYVEDRGAYGRKYLSYIENGMGTEIAVSLPGVPLAPLNLFAIPTHDYTGAWILQRGHGQPTILSRHQPGSDPVEQWRDITGPEVEALHAGSSGERLLVQVHRPRPMIDQRMFIDPALAVWEVGDPAPREYDELFLIEGPGKAFVHLDVEWVKRGEPFVFDGASITEPPPPPSQISGGGGGGDVVQEWGVVRSSLGQKLVLPGVSRTWGLMGSIWRTDVVFRNPSDESVEIEIRYVPADPGEPALTTAIELGPQEIRVVRDALMELFQISDGGGAFFITPENLRAINVTSRSYTESERGTFGTAIPALDVFAAASPRFPVTFSGAFQGSDFRTNVVVTDTSRRGTGVEMRFGAGSEVQAMTVTSLAVPPHSETQFNSLARHLNIPASETGALIFQPVSGEAIASVIVIANSTNDPAYFPPDLPAPYVRTIPLLAHVDEADGSKLRSDLFLYNASPELKSIILAAKLWNENTEKQVRLTLLPHESKVIRDALQAVFGKAGFARLRFQSGVLGESLGVRVTSRLYTLDPRDSGANYGMPVPPLNSFQAAASGDSLEILGDFGGPDFRTDLVLVDLNAFIGPSVRVKIEILNNQGIMVDSFETELTLSGGKRLSDLFRGRGLNDGLEGGVIRVSPFGGMVGAFAAVVDRRTGDPTHLGANLAAR